MPKACPTWAEYVRVNRAYDDDPDPDARNAARISTSCPADPGRPDQPNRCVKFDLDLLPPPRTTPLGPRPAAAGVGLPQRAPAPDHCRLQPMITPDAAAALPAELAGVASEAARPVRRPAPQRRWLKRPAGWPGTRRRRLRAQRRRPRLRTQQRKLSACSQARCERDLARLLLADLSMSTDAWISDNKRSHQDAIRDSSLLFAEALDRHRRPLRHLHGFSSCAGGTSAFICSRISPLATTPGLRVASSPSNLAIT